MRQTYHCTCCGKRLNPATMICLELDTRVNRYHDRVPPEHSQGAFEFGPACAKRERLAAWEALYHARMSTGA